MSRISTEFELYEPVWFMQGATPTRTTIAGGDNNNKDAFTPIDSAAQEHDDHPVNKNATAAASSPPVIASPRYRERLSKLYTRYCPRMLPHVELVLKNHEGQEEILFLNLVLKYGPEPPRFSYHDWVIAFYTQFVPAKIDQVDRLFSYQANEERLVELFRLLMRKYDVPRLDDEEGLLEL